MAKKKVFKGSEAKRLRQREWKNKRRQAWIDANGPCVKCGSKENLEVDHIKPEEKEYEISDVWSRRQEIRDAELAKCQVLCRNCHWDKSANENYVLNPLKVEKIRKMYDAGWSVADLADHLELAASTVRDVVNCLTWNYMLARTESGPEGSSSQGTEASF